MRSNEISPANGRSGLHIRLALLSGVSLGPMAAVFLIPGLAHAGCPTIISSGVTGPVDTSTACDFSVTNTGVISGGTQGVHNNTAIGTLSNAGSIRAGYSGVENSGGTIFLLSNGGTIQGGAYGIVNSPGSGQVSLAYPGHAILNVAPSQAQAFIGTLANAGSITGGTYGVYNASGIGTVVNSIGGFISYLDNAGSIGTGATAVINGGGIGTLANSGSISGSIGVANSAVDYNGNDLTTATIGTLINLLPGTIFGTITGIANSSTIAALSNNGTIAGGKFGITNDPAPVVSGPHYILNGATAARLNQPTIASLANTGSITGGSTGIFNDAGYIGTLTNSGNITGVAAGIFNNGGTIGTLDNSGQITGKSNLEFGFGDGIINAGTIAAAVNTGAILGGAVGVYNSGSVGTFNAEAGGLIFGYREGFFNQGNMASVTNGGVIAGDQFGISNSSQGGTLMSFTNNGFISGGLEGDTSTSYVRSTSEVTAGIYNGGAIGQLINTGVISGGDYGILSAGSIAQLANSGTIEGGDDGLVLAAGEAINESGGVIEGSIAGVAIGLPSQQTGGSSGEGGSVSGGIYSAGNGGGIVALSNSGVIAPHAITNAISNDVVLTPSGTALVFNQPGGLIEGAEGAVFAGAGSTLINAGTIISATGGNAIDFGTEGPNDLIITTGSDIIGTIFGGGTDGQITLDGAGAMNNPVADFGAGSSAEIARGADWTASGNWQIASLTNDGVFQPGIIGTPLNLAGNFVQNPDGTLRVLVSPADSPFVTTRFNITGTAKLAGSLKYYFAPGTYSAGTISFLSAAGGVTGGFSSVTYNNAPANGTDTLIGAADGELRLSGFLAPLDDSIFSDEIQSSAAQAESGNAALLDKASEGEAAGAGAATCAAEAAVTPADVTPGQVSGVEKMTNAVAGAICGAGGWIQATGTAMRAYGDSSVPSYDADTAGFLAGIDRPVNTYGTRLGLAVGYDETFVRNGAGSKGQVDTTRFGLFGSQALGRFTLAGDFMAGISNTTTNRVTGVGLANSTHGGDDFAGGLQIETLLQMNGISLVPRAGIRIAAVNAGAFDETGGNVVEPFSLAGERSRYTSVQPFLNLSLSHRFLTESGIVITPEAALGYFYEAGARGRAVTLNARDGTEFASNYVSLAGSAGQGEVSLSASKGMWSLYASYSADVAGNWVSQTGEAGLRLRF